MTQPAARAPSLQVGIFSNDLCISFRIILHEILDAHVFRIYKMAQDIHARQGAPGESIKVIFDRGVKSVNTWDTHLKERYRSQVAAQYRQMSDLYHHIFLMYVQEMYNESMSDVTIRVYIPSLSNLLYTFLRLACNHITVCMGEYVSDMGFMGRVLFVETIIRRTLYELLVQQNNIKSISVRKPEEAAPEAKPISGVAMSVQSEDDLHSQELAMGQSHRTPAANAARESSQPLKRSSLTMQELNERLRSGPSQNMPSMHSSSLQQPAFSPASAAGSADQFWAPSEQAFAKAPGPQSRISGTSVDMPPVPSSVMSAPQTAASGTATAVTAASGTATAVTAASGTATAVTAASGTATTPTIGAVTAAATAATAISVASQLTTPLSAAPKPAAPPLPATPRPAAQPQPRAAPPTKKDSNLFSVASNATARTAASKDPIFEIASQFTAHKPGGASLPDPKPSPVQHNDSKLDELDLLPSDQDFAVEVKRLLDTTASDTITPFDSVTNIANGGMHKPQANIRKALFFPPTAQ